MSKSTEKSSGQNTDFALSPDGSSTVPPQANDPRYTPSLLDETADSKESDNTDGGGSDVSGESKGEGVQGQAGENGGTTNADAPASDPQKTVKDDGAVKTPGTTEGTTDAKSTSTTKK